MKKLLVVLCFTLSACAGGAVAPVSVNSSIALGQDLVSDYLDRTIRLYDAKIISVDEAQKRLDQIRTANISLRVAAISLASCERSGVPVDSCKMPDGSDVASAARATRLMLQEVETYLLAKEASRG